MKKRPPAHISETTFSVLHALVRRVCSGVVRRSGKALTILALASIAGFALSCGGYNVYTTPEGFVGARVSKNSIVMDAVYMDDPDRGIEGVVRLIWWDVFNITILNESDDPIRVPVNRFSIVDNHGQTQQALPLDSVLAYRSLVLGPLMGYQQRAVKRAFWSDESIAPGTFAVGYVFFPRHDNLLPCQLVMDPDPEREEDELLAVFPAPQRESGEQPSEQPAEESIEESETEGTSGTEGVSDTDDASGSEDASESEDTTEPEAEPAETETAPEVSPSETSPSDIE